jgi:hypothetical protein
MAKKLIDQDEAARMLGVSVDELNSMRDRKQVFPKRDAGVWKYEVDQIERLIEERQSGDADASDWGDELNLDDLSLDLHDPDDVVLSDDAVKVGQSTVVGKNKSKDISLSDDDLLPEPTGDAGGSSVLGSKPKPGGSNVGGSHAGGSGLLDDIAKGPSDTDKLVGSGSLKLADDEIKLTESDSDRRKRGGSSDTKKGESGLQLAAEDEELVLESKPDSDITIGGGDSGISLVDPHDSGLSLEQPLELEGSGGLEALDLSDEDIVSLDEDLGVDEGAEPKVDDDFLLTPIEEAEDESDSGSQVIALEADEEFSGFGAAPAMLEEDLGAAAPLVGAGLAPAAALATAPALAPAGYVVEPPYTTWNFVALAACAFFLLIGGMFMYDLIRHMWSWDSPYALNSAMMDSLVKMFEK